MPRLELQYALSKRKPEELRRLADRARAGHAILGDHDELVQRARFFQALGHEVRLRILELLELEELCLCNIIEALQEPPSTVAHHLSMLEDAGVVVRRESGKFTTFRLRKELITKHRVLQ
jgi:DNA-binding transcriptional ArsR family regulator